MYAPFVGGFGEGSRLFMTISSLNEIFCFYMKNFFEYRQLFPDEIHVTPVNLSDSPLHLFGLKFGLLKLMPMNMLRIKIGDIIRTNI